MIQLRTVDEFPGFFYQPFRQILLSTPLKKFNEDEKPTNVAFVLVKEFRVHYTMALSPCWLNTVVKLSVNFKILSI